MLVAQVYMGLLWRSYSSGEDLHGFGVPIV